MSLSLLVMACFVQAAGAAYSVFVASLKPLDDSGNAKTGTDATGVTGDIVVFVTPAGLLGVGSAAGLESNLQSRRLSVLNNETTSSTDAPGVSCTTNQGGCAVSLHEGTACTDEGLQGAPQDFGANMSYGSTDSDGNAAFSFSVMTTSTGIAGKPFIVRNSDGQRVACGILALQSGANVHSASLAALEGKEVTGEVTIYTTGNKIIGAGRAIRLESNLAAASSNMANNARGVRVHSGQDCTDLDTQSGNAGNASDPWAMMGYSSTSSAGLALFTFSVTTSEVMDIADKPFVVYDNAGGHVACGLLGPAYAVFVANLQPLGNSGGGNASGGVTGEVSVFVTPSGLLGIGSASGLEQNCANSQVESDRRLGVVEVDTTTTTTAAIANCSANGGCGVAVHMGTSCADEASQGGHYFEADVLDPWTETGYPSTDLDGNAAFSFSVTTLGKKIEGKAFIVKNCAGQRVACGIFGPKSGAVSARLTELPSMGVYGEVTVYTTDTKIIGAGAATGLTPNLVGLGDPTVSNTRGVAVYSGDACASDKQGDHYFAGNASDPWAEIGYRSTSSMGTTTFTFSVPTSAVDIAERPFILHNNAAERAACGLLAGKRDDGAALPDGSTSGSESTTGGNALVNGCPGIFISLFSLAAVLFAGMFPISADL